MKIPKGNKVDVPKLKISDHDLFPTFVHVMAVVIMAGLLILMVMVLRPSNPSVCPPEETLWCRHVASWCGKMPCMVKQCSCFLDRDRGKLTE
jgi:hypothetical protein